MLVVHISRTNRPSEWHHDDTNPGLRLFQDIITPSSFSQRPCHAKQEAEAKLEEVMEQTAQQKLHSSQE